MTTKQPVWRLLQSTDTSAVYTDDTGVYSPEMEIAQFEDSDEDPTEYTVYRFSLDLLAHGVGSKLVPDRIAKSATLPYSLDTYDEWFTDSLPSVASYVGLDHAEIVALFCSADPLDRAIAYQAVGDYHGFLNLDGYPTTVTTWDPK